MIGNIAVTVVATGAEASDASSCSMLIVKRPLAGMTFVFVTGGAPVGWKVTCAATGIALGFANRTKVSKNEPVAPSARNHDVAGAVTPTDS